jgi:ribosomal protein L3 glutamine methyltransferase
MINITILAIIELMADKLDEAGLSFSDGYGQGTTNAFDEASWLVLWQLGLPIDKLDEVQSHTVTPEQVADITHLIDKRIRTRHPAAYLTREAWLLGVPFYVDERVIIPRSLIAEALFDESIDPWLGEYTTRVLDLCTGNGSLAVLAAMVYPDVVVDAADISADALAVARINVGRHELASRITLIESDGLAACPGKYDLILCNPPYVNAASMAALPAEFLAEPSVALAGGADGMDFIRQLFQTVTAHMSENAVLVLEIGHEKKNFNQAFPELEPIWLDTSAGDEQVMLLTREQLALRQ